MQQSAHLAARPFILLGFGERGSDNERKGNGGFSVNLINSQQHSF
jgi:hypothetical protein